MTLDTLIARYHSKGRLRVWSLALTFLGDSIDPRGGCVAMSDLSSVLERLRVESGAIRTALSRLARDGWVEREQAGRKSYYRLSKSGHAETLAASPRIYTAVPPEWDGRWTMVLSLGRSSRDLELPHAFRRFAPGLWIAPGSHAAPIEDAFVMTGEGDAPPWVRAHLSPPSIGRRYQDLISAWERFRLDDLDGPEDAIAARTLLIHDWRRLILRDPPLPRCLRPDGWPGAEARELVARLYLALLPLSEAWLDACEAGPGLSMGPLSVEGKSRFIGPKSKLS